MAPLFKGVKCYISPSFENKRYEHLAALIKDGGGIVTREPADANYVVSNSHRLEGWQRFRDQSIPVCTEHWVERSALNGKLQATTLYSTDPAQIFSGVVACAADLQPKDVTTISAGITELGGAWRNQFTRDVTHVFALTPDSEIYSQAMAHSKSSDANVVIVVPHWFDDVVRLGMGKLDAEPYQWPKPLCLEPYAQSKMYEELEATKKSRRIDSQKRSLFTTASTDADSTPKTLEVFNQRRVLLGTSLELGERREAIERAVERSEGIIVQLEDPEDELEKVDDCDVFVTKYRNGKAYFKAARSGKTIGTLAWLFHVMSVGALTPPLDQILHYPIPKKPIEGFSNHEITITNYTGEARDYLKRLIGAMGAKFTASMSKDNTILIAAQLEGTKVEKAQAWYIPVVNHLWLEDCFLHWRDMTVGSERYIRFPKGTDFATRLGERGILDNVEDPAQLNSAERAEDQGDIATAFGGARTQDSARDAREAADLAMGAQSPACPPNDEHYAMDEDQDMNHKAGGRSPRTPVSAKKPSPSKKRSSLKENARNDDGSLPRKSSPKTLSRPSRAHADQGEPMDLDNMDLDADTMDVPPSKKRVETKKKATAKSRRRSDVDVESEDDQDADIPAAEKPKSKGKSTSSKGKAKANGSKVRNDEMESEDDDVPVVSTSARGSRSAGRAKVGSFRPSKPEDVAEDETEDDGPPVAGTSTKTKSKPTTTKAKAKGTKELALLTDEDDEQEKDPVLASPARNTRTKKAIVQSSPKRVISVVIPASPVHSNSRSNSVRKPLAKADSIHAASSERRTQTSQPTPSTSRQRHSGADEMMAVESPVPGPSNRRAAATKASQRLHDSVMPDVVRYEKQKRNSKRHSSSASFALPQEKDEWETEDDDKKKKKGREDTSTGKKRKVAVEKIEVDSESGEEDARTLKKRKTDAKAVKLLTTGLTLSDETTKALTKLGVKFTQKPKECTHLVVKQLVRTEKFLCALAAAPYILSEAWADDSAAQKQLLPEEPYYLKDRAKEEQYSVKIVETMARAKKLKGQLLHKHIFYVTDRVSTDRDLLKSIATSHGGQVFTQQPNVRTLNVDVDKRHILSCEEDEDVWRQFALKGHPVYTSELILHGILNQDIRWDDETYRVPGSLFGIGTTR